MTLAALVQRSSDADLPDDLPDDLPVAALGARLGQGSPGDPGRPESLSGIGRETGTAGGPKAKASDSGSASAAAPEGFHAREIKEVRLRCGYSLLESLPVFHATDVYHIHAEALRRLYAKVEAECKPC